jgi:hypothetical protein
MAIQMYGFWRSLASFRVRVALKLKGLSFEETPIDILSGEQFNAVRQHQKTLCYVLKVQVRRVPRASKHTPAVQSTNWRAIPCSDSTRKRAALHDFSG